MKTEKDHEKGSEDLLKQLAEEREKVECLRKEVDSEKSKAEDYKRLLQRVQADLENQLKRSDQDKKELVKTASRDLVLKLLDVVDTMDYALNTNPNGGDGGKMLDGFRKVNDQLKAILSTEGLEGIKTDGLFNHDLHEAVETVENPDQPDGTIVEVTQRGYKLGDRLIRTSKVIVVKNRGDANG